MCKSTRQHLPVDSLIVLVDAVILEAGAEQGVPGPPLEQQAVLVDVDDARHMLVPACHALAPGCVMKLVRNECP